MTETQLQFVPKKLFATKAVGWYKLRKVSSSKLLYAPLASQNQPLLDVASLPPRKDFCRLSEKEILAIFVRHVPLTINQIAYASKMAPTTLRNYISHKGPFLPTSSSHDVSYLVSCIREQAYREGVPAALTSALRELLESGAFMHSREGNKLFGSLAVAKAAATYGLVEEHYWETHSGPWPDLYANTYSPFHPQKGKSVWTSAKVKTLWLAPGIDTDHGALFNRTTVPSSIIDPVNNRSWTVLL